MPESQTNKSGSERAGERNQGGTQGTSQQGAGGTAMAAQDRSRQQGQQGLQRSQPSGGLLFGNPWEFMDRMAEEMDRTFERFFPGFGLPRRTHLQRSRLAQSPESQMWNPRVEAFQEGDRFVVRAELPGLKKDDVQVELTNEALTITGERREERKEEREGFYQSEREYGQFYRMIPLPEGVIGESADAKFRDGVLEITMQAAPAEANRGRRVEIKE
jgi:HSP20 family protein